MDSTQSDSSSLIISSWSTISCSVVLIWLVYKMTKSEWWDIHRQTVGRDWIGIKTLVRVKWFLYKNRRDNATVAKLFKRSVNKHPDKVLFYYENQQWTFRDVDKFSNKIANYFSHTMGLEPGSEVSLFMEPCPEYVSTWLGLSKAGIIPALVNTGLRSSVLASSIAVLPNSRVLIYGPELKQGEDQHHFCHTRSSSYCQFVNTRQVCLKLSSNIRSFEKLWNTKTPSVQSSVKFVLRCESFKAECQSIKKSFLYKLKKPKAKTTADIHSHINACLPVKSESLNAFFIFKPCSMYRILSPMAFSAFQYFYTLLYDSDIYTNNL